MKSRIDTLTACRIDYVLILLPIITREEAEQSLADSGVPDAVVARVLAHPLERRPLPLVPPIFA
jgi:hypothetical protein